jgi:hypothetical protein
MYITKTIHLRVRTVHYRNQEGSKVQMHLCLDVQPLENLILGINKMPYGRHVCICASFRSLFPGFSSGAASDTEEKSCKLATGSTTRCQHPSTFFGYSKKIGHKINPSGQKTNYNLVWYRYSMRQL